jgi:hypothetical protein
LPATLVQAADTGAGRAARLFAFFSERGDQLRMRHWAMRRGLLHGEEVAGTMAPLSGALLGYSRPSKLERISELAQWPYS